MSFVHLHNHSHYSLLDGLSKIKPLVAKAKKLGLPALALTDHGNLYGAIEFYKACREAELKPIIGVEAYVATRNRQDKEPNLDSRRYHLTLLAKNEIGYRNLIKLVTRAYLEGYYYKPRMDRELLAEHHDGLICLSGCLASELSRALWNKDEARAIQVIREHQDIFGRENYYLEIMHHPEIERQTEIRNALTALSRKLAIPLVATQDSHYLEPEDAEAQATLRAIQTSSDLENSGRMAGDYSLVDEKTFRSYFAETPEAVDRTLEIAERCQLELTLGAWVFPKFPLADGITADQLLKKRTRECLAKYKTPNKQLAAIAPERMEYELSVIVNKGYSPYFLAVADIITEAKRIGIFTNTRGSAAGSFVSYLLGITNVDPLEYNLPFERFLNPERPSPPDIDMDFADTGRDRIIDYVRHKYGENNVAQIGTFGSMMARAAVRDVARALGYPYVVGDRLSRMIPPGSQGFPMSIEHALELNPDLNTAYTKEADSRRIIDLARRIEGGARHISVHAAGVVIAPSPLTDFVPIQLDPRGGKTITQFDMHSVEEAGLLKFDFLGIRNLSILQESVRLVEKTKGEKIDIEHIPLDNKKTFAMLARGETIGLFQLNGTGMTRYLKELRPTKVEDLNVMVALYRPGPIDNIDEYIARKNGRNPITFMHPKMKTFLETTYGVLVYQDDLLMTAIEVAGYNWGEVDKFRKAVGKKIPAEMAKQHVLFVEGCIKHGGMTKAGAEEIWNMFEPFQGYGFNKAHAASYGRVAYQTAYMKANYPTEYMTAVLTAESGDMETVAEIINECQRMDLPVLPPDVNESFRDFTALTGEKQDKIRFGLGSIKNLGTDIAQAIVDERKARGPYCSLGDFLERITHRNLNKKSLEALTQAGALDSLGTERGEILANLDDLLEYNRAAANTANQTSLFSAPDQKNNLPQLRLRPAPPVALAQKLVWEKDLLGLYLSGHPLETLREKIEKARHDIHKIKQEKEGVRVVVASVVEEVKTIITKRGDQMAFIRLADLRDRIEGVVFADVFNRYKEFLTTDKCLALKGRVSHRNGEPSLVVEDVKELTA